jgi:hypothetical protein
MNLNDFELQEAPLIYYSQQDTPGVYITWDRSGIPNVASYRVSRSDYSETGYAVIKTLAYPQNEYVDESGRGRHYYKVEEINSDNEVLRTSAPFKGEELLLLASLAYQIRDLLVVNVRDEIPIMRKNRTIGEFTFNNWNFWRRPEILISGSNGDNGDPFIELSENTPVFKTTDEDENNYSDGLRYWLDYQGRAYFVDESEERNPVSLMPYDQITASYSVKLFTVAEMNSALKQALYAITIQPGVNKIPLLSMAPIEWDGALVTGACYILLRSLCARLNNRETRALLLDFGKDKNELREDAKMFKEDFDAYLKAVQISSYPSIRTVVTPTAHMPGGRSRMFRYIWKGEG